MISKAQQRFLDALGALAAEQNLSLPALEGGVFLHMIQSRYDDCLAHGHQYITIEFAWIPARQGERYYDFESTATDVPSRPRGLVQPRDDGRHQLHEPPREVRGQVAGYLGG